MGQTAKKKNGRKKMKKKMMKEQTGEKKKRGYRHRNDKSVSIWILFFWLFRFVLFIRGSNSLTNGHNSTEIRNDGFFFSFLFSPLPDFWGMQQEKKKKTHFRQQQSTKSTDKRKHTTMNGFCGFFCCCCWMLLLRMVFILFLTQKRKCQINEWVMMVRAKGGWDDRETKQKNHETVTKWKWRRKQKHRKKKQKTIMMIGRKEKERNHNFCTVGMRKNDPSVLFFSMFRFNHEIQTT